MTDPAAAPPAADTSAAATSPPEAKRTAIPSRTRVTQRSDRSLRTAALQAGLKPVGNFLVKPGKPTAHGSPELHAPEDVFNHCNVRQRQIGKVYVRVYEINDRTSISTRENFIPAQIHALTPEAHVFHNSSVHASTAELTQIQTNEEEDITSHDFAKTAGASRRRKNIYYFAGGGFQSPAAKEHWLLCAHLAHTLTAKGHPTTVSIVSYPLAPNSPASASLPILEHLYAEILPSTPPPSRNGVPAGFPHEGSHGAPHSDPHPHVHPDTIVEGDREDSTDGESTDGKHLKEPPKSPVRSQAPVSPSPAPRSDGPRIPEEPRNGSPRAPLARTNTASTMQSTHSSLSLTRTRTRYIAPEEDVIFMGDSAGANIALTLPLIILDRNPHARVPSQLLLISPPVDLRHNNPEMEKVARNDPILGIKHVKQCAQAWCGKDIAPSDPAVSPLLANISMLAKRGIVVNGVIGGYDVLAPDARLFREKCQKTGVTGEWLEWDRQIHAFPLAFSYKRPGVPEANEAVEWIVGKLMEEPPVASMTLPFR